MAVPLSAVMAPDQKFSSNLTPFSHWGGVMARFAAQDSTGEIFTASWRRIVAGLARLPYDSQIRQMNEIMNARPYVTDMQLWHKSDYWATPGEFMRYGGDCEDYSLAKYLGLRSLGVPESLMRIVIVKDLQLGIPHAVMVARGSAGQTLVLDNQNKALRPATQVHRYHPYYSINHQGWWAHNAPGA